MSVMRRLQLRLDPASIQFGMILGGKLEGMTWLYYGCKKGSVLKSSGRTKLSSASAATDHTVGRVLGLQLSNRCRTPVEPKSNRSCNHPISGISKGSVCRPGHLNQRFRTVEDKTIRGYVCLSVCQCLPVSKPHT